MVLGEPCSWQELQENWCKHLRTRNPKVMTSVMSSLYASYCIHMLQSESSICGGTSQHHEYLLKNPLVTSSLFAFLDCFMWLLQIQRLAKYYPRSTLFFIERRYMERMSYENKNENNPNLVQFSRIFDFLRDFYF